MEIETRVQEEICQSGDRPDDILWWFLCHGGASRIEVACTTNVESLSSYNQHARAALERSASEIWHELDLTQPTSVRRLFWGRFRRYWNPSQKTGTYWKHYHARRHDAETRRRDEQRRGAEKRRLREQQEIDRLGVAAYSRRMQRDKEASLATRAAKVDRNSAEYLRFLEWRRTEKGRSFDTAPGNITPLPCVFGTHQWRSPSNRVSDAVYAPQDLFAVLCGLTEIEGERRKALSVRVTVTQTAEVETVPVPYVVIGGTAYRLDGTARLGSSSSLYLLQSHFCDAKQGHLFGWGERTSFWCRFPDPWDKYNGLPLPFGNPRRSTNAQVIRSLKGCISTMIIESPEQTLTLRTGGRRTPPEILDAYFADPFEREKRRVEAEREKRRTQAAPSVQH